MTCKGPDCDRSADVGDLCRAHYQQTRRGELQPLRGGNLDSSVVFKLPKALKQSAERAARREQIDPSEWWRRAGQERLKK